jgi:hypothetical protein
MKSTAKIAWIVAALAVAALFMVACDNGTTGGGGSGSPNHGLPLLPPPGGGSMAGGDGPTGESQSPALPYQGFDGRNAEIEDRQQPGFVREVTIAGYKWEESHTWGDDPSSPAYRGRVVQINGNIFFEVAEVHGSLIAAGDEWFDRQEANRYFMNFFGLSQADANRSLNELFWRQTASSMGF